MRERESEAGSSAKGDPERLLGVVAECKLYSRHDQRTRGESCGIEKARWAANFSADAKYLMINERWEAMANIIGE